MPWEADGGRLAEMDGGAEPSLLLLPSTALSCALEPVTEDALERPLVRLTTGETARDCRPFATIGPGHVAPVCFPVPVLVDVAVVDGTSAEEVDVEEVGDSDDSVCSGGSKQDHARASAEGA